MLRDGSGVAYRAFTRKCMNAAVAIIVNAVAGLIHTHLLGDVLVVRLEGVLTAAEKQLVKSLPAEKGRDLLKQVRTLLVETARPVLEAMVQEVTGVKVLSLHHDISTVTGEEVVLYFMATGDGPCRFGQYRVFMEINNG